MTLSSWALKVHQKGHIRVRRLIWTEYWAPNLYEYSAFTRFRGRDLYGRGTDTIQELALVKSVAELMERCAQIENGIGSSNGLCAHENAEKAAYGATLELIERDIFVNQMLSQSSLPQFSESDVLSLVSPAYKEFINKLQRHRIDILVFALGSFGTEKCILVLSYDKKNKIGGAVGMGINSHLGTAIEKACSESLRKIVWAMECKETRYHTLDDFLRLLKYDHDDHLRLALNPLYIQILIERIVASDYSGEFPVFETDGVSIKTEKIELKHHVFSQCPIEFQRATSPQLQEPPLGPFNNSNVNWRRFNQTKLKKRFKVEALLPHPLA